MSTFETYFMCAKDMYQMNLTKIAQDTEITEEFIIIYQIRIKIKRCFFVHLFSKSLKLKEFRNGFEL